MVLYGHALENTRQIFAQKLINRWGNRPITKTLNDVQNVLSMLSSKHAYVSMEFRDAALQQRKFDEIVLNSPIEMLINIWNRIFTHRKIQFNNEASSIYADSETENYSLADMSDGERVAIYLMAQCLCASENTILIFDEPEIHLHKSILSKLWDELEQARPDCVFVYITHDLDFASTRHKAKKIWIKEYQHLDKWDWEYLPTDDLVPDELKFQVLGSRLPILFIEGSYGSFDYQIYSQIFSEHQVIPVNGVDNVIRLTNAFNHSVKQLHHLSISGLIDRDNRSEDDINNLQNMGIYCIDVAIVENLLLVSDVFQIVIAKRVLDEDKQQELHERIFDKFNKEFDDVCANLTALQVNYLVSKSFSTKNLNSKISIQTELENLPKTISVDDIYTTIETELKDICDRQDYLGLLRKYPDKSLHGFANSVLGIKDYQNYVIRLIKTDREMVDAIKKYVPIIPTE